MDATNIHKIDSSTLGSLQILAILALLNAVSLWMGDRKLNSRIDFSFLDVLIDLAGAMPNQNQTNKNKETLKLQIIL